MEYVLLVFLLESGRGSGMQSQKIEGFPTFESCRDAARAARTELVDPRIDYAGHPPVRTACIPVPRGAQPSRAGQ